MKTRIITGAALIVLLAFGITMGGWVFSALFLFFALASIYEVFRALKASGQRVVEWPVWLCAALIFPLFFIFGSVTMLLPLAVGAFMLAAAAVMFRKEPRLEDVLLSVLPLFCVMLPAMCMLGLQNAGERVHEIMLILLAFGVPLVGDMLAYFIGSRFGKIHYCPAVSPHKTLEGAAAGLFGSVAFSMALCGIFSCFAAVPPLWHFAVLGLLGGLAGQEGDLFASLIKRYCGIKDYGKIFPGHGGFMDRMDSTYWAAIIMYIYLNLQILPVR